MQANERKDMRNTFPVVRQQHVWVVELKYEANGNSSTLLSEFNEKLASIASVRMTPENEITRLMCPALLLAMKRMKLSKATALPASDLSLGFAFSVLKTRSSVLTLKIL